MRVLILTASIGSGHKRAAQAIEAAWQKIQPHTKILLLDLLDYLPHLLVSSCLNLYLKSLAVFPQGYGYLYAWGNKSNAASKGNALLSWLLLRSLKPAIVQFAPDVVLCTHASAAAMLEFWSKKEKIKFYCAGVITDFVVHKLWLQAVIDDYFVADAAIKNFICQQKLLKISQVHAWGIPIDEQFSAYIKRTDNKQFKRILVMGGGKGLMPMTDILDKLDRLPFAVQITFITGDNKNLFTKLTALAVNSKQSIRILGFVNNVAAIMQEADLLISKAGGMSLSESLCIGMPIFLYKPLLGQERANANFCIERGAAVEFVDMDDLAEKIIEIFRIDSKKAKLMGDSALYLAKPTASKRIVEYIINKMTN